MMTGKSRMKKPLFGVANGALSSFITTDGRHHHALLVDGDQMA
jgi:hypothetical protein